MAKDRFTTIIKNHSDVMDDLERLINNFPETTKAALKAQQAVIENKIKSNWVSMAGGKTGDYIYDSIGSNTTYGRNGSDVVGTTGVFSIDRVATEHGRIVQEGKRKPINAAQIAYWVEFGTSRLRSGRKFKNATYKETKLITASPKPLKSGRKFKNATDKETELITVSPKPFISNAFYSTIEEQQKAFIKEFEKRLDR